MRFDALTYKAVIFDLFGTLVGSFPSEEYDRSLPEMATALNVSREDVVRLWLDIYKERARGVFPTVEANLEHICRILRLSVEARQIQAAAQIRRNFTQRTLTPRPDAVETLSALKAAGYKIGLISNCSAEVPLLWRDLPFAPFVDRPIFSCVVGVMKPDVRIYRLACEWLAVRPQECLYVDDLIVYLTGASQVGMQAVLMRMPCESVPAEEAWQGPAIAALKDVLALIA